MDVWAVSNLELLQTQLLEPLSLSLDARVELLGNRVHVCLALVDMPNHSPERLHQFSLPPVVYEGSFTPHLCQRLLWSFLLISAISVSVLWIFFSLHSVFAFHWLQMRLTSVSLLSNWILPFVQCLLVILAHFSIGLSIFSINLWDNFLYCGYETVVCVMRSLPYVFAFSLFKFLMNRNPHFTGSAYQSLPLYLVPCLCHVVKDVFSYHKITKYSVFSSRSLTVLSFTYKTKYVFCINS